MYLYSVLLSDLMIDDLSGSLYQKNDTSAVESLGGGDEGTVEQDRKG